MTLCALVDNYRNFEEDWRLYLQKREHGGKKILRNVSNYLPVHTASCIVRLVSSVHSMLPFIFRLLSSFLHLKEFLGKRKFTVVYLSLCLSKEFPGKTHEVAGYCQPLIRAWYGPFLFQTCVNTPLDALGREKSHICCTRKTRVPRAL